MRRDFQALLREADGEHARHGLTPAEDRRLRARLSGKRRARVSPWRVGFALAATACLAVVASRYPRSPAPPAELGGFSLQATAEGFRAEVQGDGAVRVLAGGATLADSALRSAFSVASGAELRREAGGVRVIRGEVSVEVEKHPAGEKPARVLVSGGAIEVLGTRFLVRQGESSGSVRLFEGAIRFRAADGREVPLSPGEELSWPLAPAPEPPPPPPAPAIERRPRPSAPPEPGVTPPPAPPEAEEETADELIARVAVLRRRGEFARAAAELERAIAGPLRAESRERLSFELGSLLAHQLRDRERACAHFDQHLRRFPRGRYELESRQTLDRLGCSVDPSR